MTAIHDPGGLGFRIDHVWAFLSTDPGSGDDDEGVCAVPGPGGVLMPMIAADEARLTTLRSVATVLARVTGRPIKMVRFDQRVDLEEIEP